MKRWHRSMLVVGSLALGGFASGPIMNASGLDAIFDPVVPVIAQSCNPRSPVGIAVAPGLPGRLNVTVTAGAGSIQSIAFSTGANFASVPLSVDIGGQFFTPPFIHTPPAETSQVHLIVAAAGPGAVTVPVTVVDACGAWPTFVGAGVQTGWSPTPTPIATLSELNGRAFLVGWSGTANLYIGDVSNDQAAPNSICNQSGTYGSPTSVFSIRSPTSIYGSPFTDSSAYSLFASRPPRVFYTTTQTYVGYLTKNTTLPGNIDPDVLFATYDCV